MVCNWPAILEHPIMSRLPGLVDKGLTEACRRFVGALAGMSAQEKWDALRLIQQVTE